ncbi:MAG: hypothetical protein Q8K52_06040 [Thiobacillus sp.]|nr:hypothetical protein [Thiobacillus sp.]
MPDAIGHRFVHGGEVIDSARVLDAAEIERLRGLIPLAPLHLPGNLLGVELCRARAAVTSIPASCSNWPNGMITQH